MKPHPKIRKTIKWGGAAVTALLVVVWAVSKWAAVSWVDRHGWSLTISAGGVELNATYPHTQTSAGLAWNIATAPLYFAPSAVRYMGRPVIFLPLWMLIVPLLSICAIAWRLDTLAYRRELVARLNLCPKCGYDRTGLVAGAVCPECGSGGVPA